jgi:UDP-glucose 4-epimerase
LRVLITGGSGFIGSHLSKTLREMGQATRILDLKPPSFPADYLMGDIRSSASLSRAFEGMDAVVHLAALTSVEDSIKRPADYFNTNVTGTINVMRACHDRGVRRFVHISSAAVYGDPLELPLRETSPVSPKSPYGETKLASEFCVRSFCGSYGLENVILRIFNAYGPDQPLNQYSGVINSFIENIRKGKPPVIFGDGRQSRSFIHVGDVARAIQLALESKVSGEIFNIATNNPVTIEDLAQMILRLSGRTDLQPIYGKPRPGDIRHSYAELTKARKVLGFNAEIPLEDGLKELLE